MREFATKDGKQGEQQKSSPRLNIFPPLPVRRGVTDGSTYRTLSTGPGLLRTQSPFDSHSQTAPVAFSALQSTPPLMRSPGGALTVNNPNDPFEAEADRVADQVMRMTDPAKVQRTCSCTDEDRRLQRTCASCKGKEEEDEENKKQPQVQRSSFGTGPAIAPPIVHNVLRSPGQPLDASTRSFMEPRFGQSFSHVRVHTDAKAAESARSVDALAYTVGSNIVFGGGQYSPSTAGGSRLLAHELVHTIQQDGRPGGTLLQRQSSQKQTVEDSYQYSVFVGRDIETLDQMYRLFERHAFGRELNLKWVCNSYCDIAENRGKVIPFSLPKSLVSAQAKDEGEQARKDHAQNLAVVAEKAQVAEPQEPLQGDWSVLFKDAVLRQIYFDLMEHYTGLHSPASINILTQSDLDRLLGDDKIKRYYTTLFTQGFLEFQAASGSDLKQFTLLEDRIFEQFTWGNPTATHNQLKIGPGDKGQIGIVDRRTSVLLYDEHGMPLPSDSGLLMKDHGFIGAPPLKFAINITIEDPALQLFLNTLRQDFGDPARMIAKGAQAYFDNIELVNKKVRDGLAKEVIEKFEDMLPVFVGFLAGHALSSVLLASANPILAAIGLALKGLLVAAGYIFDVQFAGSALANLLNAGYFLSRIVKNSDGSLTRLSLRYLNQAVEPIRHMISDIALMSALELAGALGKLRGRKKVEIECTRCRITEPEARAKDPEGAGPEKDIEVAGPGIVTRKRGRNSGQWTRDASGRTFHVEATLFESFPNLERGSAETTAQKKAAARGKAGDSGGHIVGHRFFGDQGSINLFPQEGEFNNTAYRTMENELADWTKNGKQVNITIRLESFKAFRPEVVRVKYQVIDPVTGETVYSKSQTFINNNGQVFQRVPAKSMATGK